MLDYRNVTLENHCINMGS